MPPPTSPRAVTAHFTRGGRQSATFMCEIYSLESLAAEGGEGRMICETVPFVNGSSAWLQTQNEDSQYHSAPLLFSQDCLTLTGGFWQALANLYSEVRL